MDRSDVIAAICEAIFEGRHSNPEDHFHFASDCICRDRDAQWNFDFDRDFLNHITAAITEAARTYPNVKRWDGPEPAWEELGG